MWSSSDESRLDQIQLALDEDNVAMLTAVPNWKSIIGRLPVAVYVMVCRKRIHCLETVLASDAVVDVNYACPAAGGGTPIMHASSIAGNVVAVRTLLRHRDKHPIDMEHRDESNYTALGTACLNGLFTVVKELLTVDDLDLNSVVGRIWPPLTCVVVAITMRGADGDALKIVRLLVADARCDVNGMTVDGFTALQLAAEKSNIDVVRELLVDRCDPSIKSSEGRTAVEYAKTSAIRTIIYEFTKKHEGRQRAKMTTDSGRIAELKSAIKEDDAVRLTAVPNWKSLIGRLPLVVNVMVRNRRQKCLATVLASDADVRMDTKDNTLDREPFINACGNGNLTAVRTMLRHRDKHPFDIDALSVPINITGLSAACLMGRIEVVKELLTVADIDLNAHADVANTHIDARAEKVYSPLMATVVSAAGGGDATVASDIVRLLVADGRCDVNERRTERCVHPGFTALHLAVTFGQVDLVRALLVDRCDVDIKCMAGRTPMEYCESADIRSMLTQFIEKRKKRKADEAKESARLAKINKEEKAKEEKEALAAELRAKEERRVAAIAVRRPPPKCAKCSIVGTSVDILLMPCRHLCLCQRCAKKMKKENKHFKCPFPECGEIVQKCHTVYY